MSTCEVEEAGTIWPEMEATLFVRHTDIWKDEDDAVRETYLEGYRKKNA